MNHQLVECYTAGLSALAGSNPGSVERRAKFEAEERGFTGDFGIEQFIDHLLASGLNDLLRMRFHLAIGTWDSEETPTWGGATAERTPERRSVLLGLLGFATEHQRSRLNTLFPVATDDTIVISDSFKPWYADRKMKHDFYWNAYREYLLSKNWKSDAVTKLGTATTKVVERLSDPTRPEAFQAKGLVVGYVQSGKTANFTGVVAKSIDAGYRLVIVLTGTIELLRAQTQRRLDMELVGVENILRGADPSDPQVAAHLDYQQDPAWPKSFLGHGFIPSTNGLTDIVRLTTHTFDYKSLKQGITALEFEKEVASKPLYDAVNLQRASARLMVVKKNKAVLTKLVKDLKSIASRLHEIPVLIVDDESDQASVNTSDPKKWKKQDETERTAINGLISQLLSMLPRAQYLGYTATPFANVFIDPSDVQDIFPKDFLISLERPEGYMGVRDFHDLDLEVEPEDRNVANSNEKAYVRDVRTADSRLAEALDAFVLSGAVKLYRQSQDDDLVFKHHTMLVHQSVQQIEHRVLAAEIESIWNHGSYASPSGLSRLEELWSKDFLPVSAARATDPLPASFDELKPFLSECLNRINAGGKPYLIVNGDKDIDQQKLDFDQNPVWRILIGGTKLSRGFTVEGLTVSYYRRRTKQADTLLQMGRWFGYRPGYQDLVRLYIGREEPDRNTTYDLYAAFEAIMQDEEHFRAQLKKYSTIGPDGVPELTPMEIPPLVAQHLPDVRPSARGKMFNAKLVARRTPGEPVEPVAYPKDAKSLAANYAAMLPILTAADRLASLVVPATVNSARSSFPSKIGVTSNEAFLAALRSLTWTSNHHFEPHLAYFVETAALVDDWFVVLPQQSRRKQLRNLPGLGQCSIFERKRSRDPLFQAISDPKHRSAVLRVAGARASYADAIVEEYVRPRRGALLVYPIVEEKLDPPVSSEELEPRSVVLGLTIVAPTSARLPGSQLIEFTTRNKAQEKAAIVDVTGVP